ncbi:cyclic nucleotide-binding domain-containing protein [Paroceanicella profunda]|uniref:Cyclic nucleotide-binding domain-containing protein n=1 Tax=Paroceanicella profunda TaxID=2579971 RepID=A0A5B8FW73_9RHOB|nr:helix-turn-helix domain-containing protein [Paroceanicella profunda]QDL92705.1 cyclic nucleotide-binding domain-containing protein [Paroceanicella profunda]
MTLHSTNPEGRKPVIRCAACPIADRAVCSYSTARELSLLEAIKTYRTYLPGDEIQATGETAPQVGSVVEGIVSLSRLMADGRRQMVGLLFPGDFLGRATRETAPYDAIAVGQVTLCQFDRRRFETLLRESPALNRRLLDMTLDELDAAREWMVLLGRKTAREKIASFIALTARRSRAPETPEGLHIALPLTREAMADYLGLTIETVSRQIGALKRDGLIILIDARHLVIPDLDALGAEAGDDVV